MEVVLIKMKFFTLSYEKNGGKEKEFLPLKG